MIPFIKDRKVPHNAIKTKNKLLNHKNPMEIIKETDIRFQQK